MRIRMFAGPQARLRLVYGSVGAALGVLILHPVTMVLYWFEHHNADPDGLILDFVQLRLHASFSHPMLAMTGMFAVIGICIGLLFAVLQSKLLGSLQLVSNLQIELARGVPSLMAQGEGERVEFKSTIRWDLKILSTNKALERVVMKTIAGFANSSGGNLLIGVDDEGSAIGLEQDYATLKQKGRDGFEQFIHSLVKDRLGGDICSMIHVVFATVDDHDVARVIVEPAGRPVYLKDSGQRKFYVRTGNSTRELDVPEAVDHIAARWEKQWAPPA